MVKGEFFRHFILFLHTFDNPNNYSTNLQLKQPLSNVQIELLKLYTGNVSDDTLIEMKKTLAKFFLNKTRQEADMVWEQKQYSDAFFEKID